MNSDIKLLLSGLGAFYAAGLLLLVLTYIFDMSGYFIVLLTFWIKATMAAVLVGMTYWLYCILASFAGAPPRAPFRFLGKIYFWTAVALLVLPLIGG